uniref:SBNO2 n=1 Tax=Sphenodon punctatus TaxID=8508 RepID=A0A8D0GPI6_SPHPU
MPSLHPTMDGGKNYPQHAHQPSGNTLYSLPSLQSQLGVPARENSVLASEWWSPYYSSAPFSTSSFPSENQQYFNTTSDFYMNPISRQPFPEIDCTSVDPAYFLPKNGDFTQDSSYLEDISLTSLFSSPADSLSSIADQDYLPADSLGHLPTIGDIHAPEQNQIELYPPGRPFMGLDSLDNQIAAVQNTPLLQSFQVRKNVT